MICLNIVDFEIINKIFTFSSLFKNFGLHFENVLQILMFHCAVFYKLNIILKSPVCVRIGIYLL